MLKRRLLKLYKWEFWPFWFFYIPVYFYWLYLSWRARSFFFFSAANPLMELGGFSNYSKYNVLKNIPPRYIPNTLLVAPDLKVDDLKILLLQRGFAFPLIAKPDRGERGKGVTKINNFEELNEYLKNAQKEMILQEFIDYPLEFGVMYYRFPNERRGHISSVVEKVFLSVTGDGRSSVRTLVQQNSRTHLFLKHLNESYPQVLDQVPPQGEKLILEPIGNHSRGTVFLDANHLINEEMVEVFDRISRQVQGFYFGRYDLKVKSLEDLYNGENIKIMELNGANSEPAHIYDPHMPILQAYRYLFSHWTNLYNISTKNHELGIRYIDPRYAFSQVVKQIIGN